MLAGPEDGSLMYNEGGKLALLYFERSSYTVYVLTDAAWEKQMPDWAKHRKAEIMGRIKQAIKTANYIEFEDLAEVPSLEAKVESWKVELESKK